MTGRRSSPAFIAYGLGVRLLGPALPLLLNRRARRGKEDPARLAERRGAAPLSRPDGPLLWVHAASVGESLAVLPVIEIVLARAPGAHALLTTQTLTAAGVIAERGVERVLHQFAPLDHPAFVRRFLDHWRPEAALFVESELWPNLLGAVDERDLPAALLNARMTERTAAGWARAPAMAARMFGAFRLILAADEASANRIRRLGGGPVDTLGNLKWAAPPLPADAEALDDLTAMIAGRPAWTAASTHPGEEAMVARAHAHAAARLPGLLTLLAPRHPDRGEAIARALEETGLRVARRSLGEPIEVATDIYLADTLGELGLLYRAGAVAFVGGSLVPKGGQNPLEPARLERPVLSGPHTDTFADVYTRLFEARAMRRVVDGVHLGAAVADLFEDAPARRTMAAAAKTTAEAEAGVLDATLDRLRPLLPWIGA